MTRIKTKPPVISQQQPVLLCSAEEIRRRNIEENNRILAEIGLPTAVTSLRASVTNKVVAKTKRVLDTDANGQVVKRHRSITEPVERRTSLRQKNQVAPNYTGMYGNDNEVDDEIDGSEKRRRTSHSINFQGYIREKTCTDKSQYRFSKPPKDRQHIEGAIPGIECGFVFHSREEASYAGVHRGLVSGISGNEEKVYSICLNGGYEDDVDLGHNLCFTGGGGRNLKGTKAAPKNCRVAPQSMDQTLTSKNLGLYRNIATGMPVRVIRGYKLDSKYAPNYGYRYDGLYKVVRHCEQIGQAQFKVQRFFMQRIPGQPSLIEKVDQEEPAVVEGELATVKEKNVVVDNGSENA